MDPLSILSVVAAATQFADYGQRLFSEYVRVHRGLSVAESRAVELVRIAHDLEELSQRVDEKISAMDRPDRILTATEAALLDECARCKSASHEILQSISRLQSHGVETVDFNAVLPSGLNDRSQGDSRHRSKLDSFKMALRLVWNQQQIDRMAESLSNIKSSLMQAIISNLWERSVAQNDALSQVNPPTRHEQLIRQLNAKDVDAVYEGKLDSVLTHQREGDGDDSKRTDETSGPKDATCTDILLHSLRFGPLNNRFDAIPEAYQQTFEWIFREPPQSEGDGDGPLWSTLPGWLEHDSENVYWITGKPGSGKSTMMKYLARHNLTVSCLQKWSTPHRVLVATFYSWNAGTDLQKSQEGLLRTLLYQIIDQAPETALTFFPGRWAILKIFGKSAAKELPPWTWRELYDSITSLNQFVGNKFKLAIFVDGLDEFDGDHTRLIDLVQKFHSRPGIKVCLSSRPWNAFRDAFASCPQLRMEALTKRDMKIFVRGRFNENVAFSDLKAAQPTNAEDLLLGIVEKAKGVFLWVSVVTNAILTGLTEGDELVDSKTLLDELPTDLSKLYASLWYRIKPEYKQDRARLLLVFRAYTHSPVLNPLYAKVELPAAMPAKALWVALDGSLLDSEYIIRTLIRRLNSRTMGLLEISPANNVDYLHRTARDWINTLWPEIVSEAPEIFDAHLALLRLTVSEIEDWPENVHLPNKFNYYYGIWERISQCFYHASKIADNPGLYDPLVASLDRLEELVRPILANTIIRSEFHWTSIRRGSAQKFGLASLAAEFGVIPYVRAIVASNADYLLVDGNEDDLISCVVLGPGKQGILERELDAIPFYQSHADRIKRFISEQFNFDHVGRYRLAAHLALMTATKGKASASQLKRLARLKKEVVRRSGGTQQDIDFTETIPLSPGGKEMPYGLAVVELLKSFGVKVPLMTRFRMLKMST